MEIVELRVQVEKSQLDALQAQVEALKKTTINLGVGSGGSGKSGDPTAGVRAGLAATDKQAQKTGQSIMSVMGKVAKWTAVTTAVYAPIKAFKEALTTIKALDTEMVNVQKVTGATAAQMKKYQDQAYALASQYGRNALDVAESMTAFARAGYGDQIDQMAELSTLLQNVGYVSADTANSMLLAVDAAWHLNGSQTELMAVLDGVDKITNQNATDFEKMARGMTVAASVFAESGESIQTFASMVGTGTAVTQRSGEEISRGLRTIMMNIRQIKGETEDGELIDGESIAKASAALKEFAGISTMENGELRKGSDVLADLAAKWKDLDSVQQSAIAEALAGKRQANILTALMGNWEMYEKQMEEYATAAGTALKENEIYMDSWAAKSEQLKSKWTEFVSGFVNTDVIKGSLDGIIGALEFLDSDLGHAIITASGFALAVAGIFKAFKSIAGVIKASQLTNFLLSFGEIASGQGIFAALSQTLALIGPLGVALAGLAAIVATPALVDFFTTDYAEQGEKVSQLTAEYEELYGAESEYQALIEKRSSDTGLNDWEQSRLAYLEEYRKELKETIKAEQEIAASKYQEQYGAKAQSTFDEDYYRNGGRGNRDNETVDVKNLREAKKAFEELNQVATSGQMSQKEYQQGIDDILASYEDFYQATKKGLDEGWLNTDDLTEAQKQLMDLYETMQKLRDVPLDKLDVATAIENFGSLAEIGDKTVVNWQKLKKTMEEAGASAEEIEATLASMQQDDTIVLIDVEADGIDGTLEKLDELGIAVKDAEGWKINVDGLSNLLTELGFSKDQIDILIQSLGEINGVSFVDAEGNVADLATATANAGSAIANTIDNVKKKADELNAKKPNVTMSATDKVSGVVDDVKKKVGTIPRTVGITITANAGPVVAAVNVANAAIATIQKAKSALGLATGTQDWQGGPVLLGDEKSSDGSPRPELVITKAGRAFIAGMAGPTMANLPAGSRVYPYSDTKNILSGMDMTEVQAFGAGNDKILNHYLNPQTSANKSSDSSSSSSSGGSKTKSGSSKTASKSGGSKSKGSSSGSGSSSSDKAEEDAYLEQLKKELELLQAQYSYLEASNASTGELRDKSTEIQGKLHEINERLRETGGEEKDIVDNSTAWWQEIDKQKETLEKELSLLRAEYDYLEASGASTDELNKKSKQIQDKLHEINETLRAVNGSQEEITENSTAWFEELKKIQDAQIEVYEKERDLLQSEADLMSKDGTRPDVRIAKMREIQDCLHRQAEYMRSIKASQAEINQLSIQWWEIQNDILAIQQDLVDELNNAINAKLKLARKERDAELKLIDEQISKLQEERDIQQDQLDIEEKRKAVTEARIALENAQRQRTVRYYNAATGQWEWAADAKNVASARKTYEQAQKDYQQEQRDREYDLRIKELELQKEDINNRYDLLESRWEQLSESFETPLRSIEDILRDLLATGKLSNEQVALVKELVGDIDGYTLAILKTLLSYAEYQTVNGPATGKEYAKYVVEWLKENGWTEENVAKAWEEVRVASATEGNGAAAAYFAAAQANAAAEAIKAASGNKTTNNYAPSANDSAAVKAAKAAAETASKAKSSSSSSSSASSSSSSTKYSTSATGTSSSGGTYTIESSKGLNFVNNAKSGETMTGGDGSTWTKNKDGSTTIKKNGTTYTVYDEGGVLSGLGGIKATMEDEIVIPPDIAKFMLNPSANQQFKRRMAELGYLYGTGSLASTNLVGSMQKLASNDHYGDVYNYGNISLTENQARSMTVYELAQKSRSLSVYSAS